MSWDGRIRADARQIPLADSCVQCVVTSPPYWGLRDYGNPGQIGLEKTPHGRVALDSLHELQQFLRPYGTAVQRQRDQGWVYVLRVLDEGCQPVKIGITLDRTPHARIRQIARALPYPVEVIGVKQVNDPRSVELTLHGRFHSARLNGEWFRATTEQVKTLVGDFSLHGMPSDGPTDEELEEMKVRLDSREVAYD